MLSPYNYVGNGRSMRLRCSEGTQSPSTAASITLRRVASGNSLALTWAFRDWSGPTARTASPART